MLKGLFTKLELLLTTIYVTIRAYRTVIFLMEQIENDRGGQKWNNGASHRKFAIQVVRDCYFIGDYSTDNNKLEYIVSDSMYRNGVLLSWREIKAGVDRSRFLYKFEQNRNIKLLPFLCLNY